MVMNAPMITVQGWLGADVRHFPAHDQSVAYSSFRLAVTPRYLDRAGGGFRDGATEWFTVKTWRQTAENVAETLRRGDPVVVTGRMSSGLWVDKDGVPHTELVIEAVAVGPDLTWRAATLRRIAVPRPGETVPAGPIDLTGAMELPDDHGRSPDEPPADLDELLAAGDPFAGLVATEEPVSPGDDAEPAAPGRGRPALAGRK